jgi:DNA-directed RNA polymerase subunit RPC12/RpoP
MTEVSFICYKCGKEATVTIQLLYDSSSGPIISFPTITCPYCSAQSKHYGPIIYACRDRNILYISIPSDRFNKFEWYLNIVNSIINEYLYTIGPTEQNVILNMKRRYVDAEIFLLIIANKKSTQPIMGLRKVRFTPALKIKTDSKYQSMSRKVNLDLSKNDIAYIDNGISSFTEMILEQTERKLLEKGFPLFLKKIDEDQHAIASFGLSEIILVIATMVVLPLLVNCLSDIISDLRHGSKATMLNDKGRIEKDDYIKILIKVNNSKTVYNFEGDADAIVKVLKNFGEKILPTINIPNVCHIEGAIDNVITCQSSPHSIKNIPFNNAAEEFSKYFDLNSAVEIIYENKNTDDEEILSRKAKILMDSGDFESAYWLLFPFIEKAQTIEFIFNFAYCLSKLKRKKEANEMFYNVIKMYLLNMDLTDLSMFEGNDSPELIKNINEKLITLGIPTRNNNGNINYPINDNDIKATAKINFKNRLLDFIHNYEKNFLQKEAQLNKDLFHVNSQIDKWKNTLNEINNVNTIKIKKQYNIISNNNEQKYIDEIKNNISELEIIKKGIIEKIDELKLDKIIEDNIDKINNEDDLKNLLNSYFT